MGLSGAAAWLSRSKTAASTLLPERAGAEATQPTSRRSNDECATLLEEVARRARRVSLLPASVIEGLFTWAPHANGANVRAIAARSRLPQRWRKIKSIHGVCMGEPIAIDVYRPDDTGSALNAPAWVTIGAILSGEGPAMAITGTLGPTALRQLQADDRWLLLGAAPAASANVEAPPSIATTPRTAKPPPKKNVASSMPAVTEAIKTATEAGPLSTLTNLVKAPSAMFASDDASAKLMQMADVVRKAAGLPAAPPSGPLNEAQGKLSAVTKSINAVTNTAIQQTEAAKARARAQAALAAVQKGARS